MKIFKRDPADISLPNFTNHSQWPTTGSHLPINFPSVVLVSGCPITSNNGHPRAIYRVCARHECLQTRERSSKQRSWLGRDRPRFQHWSPNLGPRALRNLISPIQPSIKRGGTRGNGVERVRVRAFLPPLWRISDVALKLKLAEWKKKSTHSKYDALSSSTKDDALRPLGLSNGPSLNSFEISSQRRFVERGHGRA